MAADALHRGELVAIRGHHHALACHVGDKAAVEKLIQIRQLAKSSVTPACRDLSELSTYARVENADYRLLNATLLALYFHLQASKQVPKRLAS